MKNQLLEIYGHVEILCYYLRIYLLLIVLLCFKLTLEIIYRLLLMRFKAQYLIFVGTVQCNSIVKENLQFH